MNTWWLEIFERYHGNLCLSWIRKIAKEGLSGEYQRVCIVMEIGMMKRSCGEAFGFIDIWNTKCSMDNLCMGSNSLQFHFSFTFPKKVMAAFMASAEHSMASLGISSVRTNEVVRGFSSNWALTFLSAPMSPCYIWWKSVREEWAWQLPMYLKPLSARHVEVWAGLAVFSVHIQYGWKANCKDAALPMKGSIIVRRYM